MLRHVYVAAGVTPAIRERRVMRGPGSPHVRPLLAALGVVGFLTACTSGSATPTIPDSRATATGTTAATETSPSPTTEPSDPTATSEDPAEVAVRAAYRRYLDTTVEAMRTGDTGQIAGARGQALAAAQGRVTALRSQGRLAKGELIPAIQAIEVGDGVAHLKDCYRQDIVEHDSDSDEVVADRNGLRVAASAALEQDGDDWVVAEFVQGDVCVPDEMATVVEGRYVAFWEAVTAAGAGADPDHAALAETTAGGQLDGLRDALARFRDEGLEVRDESVPHPEAVRLWSSDTVAIVRDCRELDADGGVYDAETGELVEGGAEPGQRALWETRLEIIDGAWKVVDADEIEEDSACEPAAS